MTFNGEPADSRRLYGWTDWYRFAREELGYAHDESTEYANLRYVEDQNRDVLRSGGDGEARASLPYD